MYDRLEETTEMTYYYGNGNQYNNKKGKNRKNRKTVKKAGIILCAGLLFGSAAGGAFQLTNYLGNIGTENQIQSEGSESKTEAASNNLTDNYAAKQVSSVSPSTSNTNGVAQVVEAVMPSIVSITNQSVEEVRSMFQFGQSEAYETESNGSGIIIGENESELLIATNYHVVEGADSLTACFEDESVVEAKLKGTDSVNDLAVIAVSLDDISEETKNVIAVASLGNSEELVVGEQVVAIGNALGYGQSVTTGIVSALNREIETSETTSSIYIQTDAAINAGNSGGALVNMKGEVIGINSAKISGDGVEGMGFAIPMSSAETIIADLKEQSTKEKVAEEDRGYLGITGADVSSEVSEVYDIPEGVYVNSVTDDSSWYETGLQRGDIITHINGTKITALAELQSQLTYYAAGDAVTLTIQRKGEGGEYLEQTVSATLRSTAQTYQEQDIGYEENNRGGFGYR